jgi:hypothetical protein
MAGVESLKFFIDRLELAGPDGFQLGARSRDRTVDVIRKWQTTSAALRQARSDTMLCLSARPGKGRTVSFEVVDEERFNALQEAITGHEEQIKALEHAIRELDALANGGELWYSDLESMVGSYTGTEGGEHRRLAHLASAILSRKMNSGKTTEDILAEDEEYQRFSKIAEEQIENANKELAKLRPALEQARTILEAVGA